MNIRCSNSGNEDFLNTILWEFKKQSSNDWEYYSGDVKVSPYLTIRYKNTYRGKFLRVKYANASKDYTLSTQETIYSSMKNVTYLDLCLNKLESLHDSIGSLVELKVLILSDNQLGSLPETISSLKKLWHLNARKNNLKELPKTFFELTNIKELILTGNKELVLPRNIAQQFNLLKTLESDTINFNKEESLLEFIK